jgi:hypothetical protein
MPEAERDDENTLTLEQLLGEDEEEEEKPFGDDQITEDEAVEMTRR